jgi:hypothetical protein
MRAHHIIESLNAQGGDRKLLANLVERSHKFTLNPGQLSDEIFEGASAFAWDLINNGVFPLPYDETLFEFGPDGLINGAKIELWTWALVFKANIDGLETIVIRSFVSVGDNQIILAPVTAVIAPAQEVSEQPWRTLYIDDEPALNKIADALDRNAADAVVDGAYRSWLSHGGVGITRDNLDGLNVSLHSDPKEFFRVRAKRSLEIAMRWTFVAIGLLSARGVDAPIVSPSKALNAARAKRGRPPIFEYRTIITGPTSPTSAGVAIGGERRSPRMHWRRGHVRTQSSGVKTMVRPCLVGDLAAGAIAKDYAIDVSRGVTERDFSAMATNTSSSILN